MTNRWDSKVMIVSVWLAIVYFHLLIIFLPHDFWSTSFGVGWILWAEPNRSLACYFVTQKWLANNIKSFKSKLRIIWQAIQVRPLEVWSFFQHHNKKLTLSAFTFNNIYPNLSHSNVVACTLTTLRCQITTSDPHSTKNLWAQSQQRPPSCDLFTALFTIFENLIGEHNQPHFTKKVCKQSKKNGWQNQQCSIRISISLYLW